MAPPAVHSRPLDRRLSMSQVNEEHEEDTDTGPLRLMSWSPCIVSEVVCDCPALRRSRGFAATVMNLVSVDCLTFELSGQAGSFTGNHVLFVFSHEPVLH